MNQTEQLIKVGTAYIAALNKLEESHPEHVSQILDILNCIHPGYYLGVYIEEPWYGGAVTHRCDQSWFHCYQGEEEPIMRRPYKFEKWKDGDSDNMLYLRFTFQMFNHLTADLSPMGASRMS